MYSTACFYIINQNMAREASSTNGKPPNKNMNATKIQCVTE